MMITTCEHVVQVFVQVVELALIWCRRVLSCRTPLARNIFRGIEVFGGSTRTRIVEEMYFEGEFGARFGVESE